MTPELKEVCEAYKAYQAQTIPRWIGILKDMSEILEVRIAAVCVGVDVTVIGKAQS